MFLKIGFTIQVGESKLKVDFLDTAGDDQVYYRIIENRHTVVTVLLTILEFPPKYTLIYFIRLKNPHYNCFRE